MDSKGVKIFITKIIEIMISMNQSEFLVTDKHKIGQLRQKGHWKCARLLTESTGRLAQDEETQAQPGACHGNKFPGLAALQSGTRNSGLYPPTPLLWGPPAEGSVSLGRGGGGSEHQVNVPAPGGGAGRLGAYRRGRCRASQEKSVCTE